LQEAIRKLSSWPAQQLNIRRRGSLKTGNYADIVIFDPEKVKDKATYDKPHQLSEGVLHVWVNGIQVLKNGTHTGALPGHFVKGPGWDHRVYK
ncbi:MAG TPA: amidohydrolase family protein, partial [Chitinophagaceae bacterium]|nr:amidohydrolase family protein [Chitinophagaceae bacterium]